MNVGEDNTHGEATKLLDYKKLKEIAIESLEKRKKHNWNKIKIIWLFNIILKLYKLLFII